MSVHKSLRTGGSLAKHRNVLKRGERIKILEDNATWREGQNSVLGLRKVKSIKVAAKKKAAKNAVEGAEARKQPRPPPARASLRRYQGGRKAAAPAAAAAKPAGEEVSATVRFLRPQRPGIGTILFANWGRRSLASAVSF